MRKIKQKNGKMDGHLSHKLKRKSVKVVVIGLNLKFKFKKSNKKENSQFSLC